MTKTLHPQFEELLAAITPTQGTGKFLREILKRQVKKELGATKQKALIMFIKGKLFEEEKDTALSGAGSERLSLQAELLENVKNFENPRS